jgi:hypothetical protein
MNKKRQKGKFGARRRCGDSGMKRVGFTATIS